MRYVVAVMMLTVVLCPLTARAIDVWGDQSGTWTRDNSPYNVIGEIRVPPESTLVIEPGIVVNFQGHYKFIVDSAAMLLAVGTEVDSIHFTTEDTATGWHGIRFLGAHSNSQVSYCQLEYGKAIGSNPDFSGGAIYCESSSPTISDNTVVRNWAQANGGGIYFWTDSSPTISHNAIIGNSADHGGGGICCARRGSAEIINNTISGNTAVYRGGGIYCHYSDPTIRNTILWGNVAPSDSQIAETGADPSVTYCDIQGGWDGQGNIDASPRFVGPHYQDFRLRWGSPCIDAGHPTSPLDPDGTPTDMGAYYFNQDVDGVVEVYPRHGPIIIPPWGGNVRYDGCVVNEVSCHTVLLI